MPILSLKQALINGLRPKEEAHRNTDFLLDSYNCRHLEFGAGIFDGITQPLVKVVGHPFPQMILSKRKLLMIEENAVTSLSRTYVETPYTFDTLAAVTGHDSAYVPDVGSLATGGGVWHFAEIGDNFILCNGEGVAIQSTKFDGTVNGTDTLQTSNTVYPITCCELNGRFIFGGLENLRSAAFDTAMNVGANYSGFDSSNLTNKSIYWSSIGGVDGLYWFFTTLMTNPNEVMETLQRNEWGIATVPWQEGVFVVKPLGNGFMAYGEFGITYFKQNGLGFDQIDLTTWGVYDRGSVGGNKNEHLFLSLEGALWKITPNLNMIKLDYREFLDGFVTVGTPITISYAEQMNEYYISNSATCYLLTQPLPGQYALSQCPQLITSTVQHLGNEIGFFEPYIDTDPEMRILSDVFDMGNREVKTIRNLETAANDPDDFDFRIHYRIQSNAAFNTTDFVTSFADGLIPVAASGVDFMVEGRALTGTNKSMEELFVNWDQGKRMMLL